MKLNLLSSGGLCKGSQIIREKYSYHFNRINSLAQVKATIRAGEFAWPGGYQLFFVTSDGAALCFKCARKKFRQVVWDYLRGGSSGWRISACEINYEDNSLCCDYCNKQIPSAYGEPCKQ